MSQKKPRNLPSLSVQVKQIVARRSLRRNAHADVSAIGCLPQLSVEVERATAVGGQT